MKALVLWAEPHSTNLGVRALSSGTTQLLKRTFPGIQVYSQGFGPGDAPVRIGAPRPHVKRLLTRHDPLVDWVRGFDLVVDTGAGDSFADIYGLRRLLSMTLMREVVWRAGVPLVMGPQTIGPFVSRRGRFLAARSLRRASLVMSRDDQSAEQSAALGRQVDVRTTDVVFALEPATATGERDVVVNVSGLLWGENAHVDSQRYRAIVTGLCRKLQGEGRTVSLLAHVLNSALADNDVPAVEALAQELGGEVEVLVPDDLPDVRRMLATAQVVIGSRMHACLNALSLGVPALPLAYSRKFDPLLQALHWPFTVDLRVTSNSESEVVDQAHDILGSHDFHREAVTVRSRAEELLERAESALTELVARRA